jgi:hypothetical protein
MGWNSSVEESLDNEARRLSEVFGELGQIGKILDQSATRIDPKAPEQELTEKLALEVNRTRVPGFCGYHLAEECFSLLKLLSVRIALLERDEKKSRDTNLKTKLTTLKKVIDDSKSKIRRTIEEMKPWSNLEGERIAEAIAARAATE